MTLILAKLHAENNFHMSAESRDGHAKHATKYTLRKRTQTNAARTTKCAPRTKSLLGYVIVAMKFTTLWSVPTSAVR